MQLGESMVKFVKVIPLAAKVGTVTIRYPYGTPLVTESFRGAIEIDPEKCTGCGACTRVCPSKALGVVNEEDTLILRYFVGRCIFCGACADACPDKAIKITREFELASSQVSELYSDVEHELHTCRRCGIRFASKKLLNKVGSLCETIPGEVLDLCPNCKRIETISRALLRGGAHVESNYYERKV